MTATARLLTIHGRVQGVFYRNWAVQTAASLGLAGWVRNRADGSVEALIEGSLESIERFVMLAHEGPAAAIVNHIDMVNVAPAGLSSFDKRPTK